MGNMRDNLKHFENMTRPQSVAVLILLILVSWGMWGLASMYFTGTIENKDSTIELLGTEVDSLKTELEGYRALMPGKTVEEIGEHIKQLEEVEKQPPTLRTISEWWTKNPDRTHTYSIHFKVVAHVRPASVTLKIAAKRLMGVEIENYTGSHDMQRGKNAQGVDVMHVSILDLLDEHTVRIRTRKRVPIIWDYEF